jgi:hypothetical protein
MCKTSPHEKERQIPDRWSELTLEKKMRKWESAINRRDFCAGLGAAAWMTTMSRTLLAEGPGGRKPNVVYILADDLGWGDLDVYNSHSAIPTSVANQFASEGMRFTDMHSSSAVCTPSRYSILTGRYCWRSRLAWLRLLLRDSGFAGHGSLCLF